MEVVGAGGLAAVEGVHDGVGEGGEAVVEAADRRVRAGGERGGKQLVASEVDAEVGAGEADRLQLHEVLVGVLQRGKRGDLGGGGGDDRAGARDRAGHRGDLVVAEGDAVGGLGDLGQPPHQVGEGGRLAVIGRDGGDEVDAEALGVGRELAGGRQRQPADLDAEPEALRARRDPCLQKGHPLFDGEVRELAAGAVDEGPRTPAARRCASCSGTRAGSSRPLPS
nr:hypothetical protein GCM10025732_28560 [Glycomyces mayteni]